MTITRAADDRPTTLYRYYDADGNLLYVGITVRGVERMNQHWETSRWWHQAVRSELVHYATRSEALEAEAREIILLAPRYNVMGVPGLSPGQMEMGLSEPSPPPQGSRWLKQARALQRVGVSPEGIARATGRSKWKMRDTLREHGARPEWQPSRTPFNDLIRLCAAFDWPDLEPILDAFPGNPPPE